MNDEDEKIDRLVRDYSASTDLVSLDWKKMKIPPVLPSSDHAWLFKLMQPMKEILQIKETKQNDLGRDLIDNELAEATKMDVGQLKKQLQAGHAARNKLIKLDWLKPKESLVIRQGYGLDGKGDRTHGEIAGNLNISREMVRKHEVKALMKLEHPARLDYLRCYIYK